MKKTGKTAPIQHIAKLAHLQLTPQQLATFETQLSSIIDYMQEVTKLDIKDIPETARVIDEENVMREDVVEPSLTQEQALSNGKNTHQGYFKVPAVLENRGDV